ncbi:DUF3801 domain-containing protein [Trueperella sp. LYQ143]|uniref:DUF3801 domain-containing protein n=1 Tax=Trueperella sp. LYQ143 TaxID=3391059 RepID=UPI0039833D25
MSIIGGEQLGHSVSVFVGNTAIRVAVGLTNASAHTLKNSARLGLWTVSRLPHTQILRKKGQLTAKRIVTQGDARWHQIDDSTVNKVVKMLKKLGVDYAVKVAPDGQKYLVHSGKDMETVKYALQQLVNVTEQISREQPLQEEIGTDDRSIEHVEKLTDKQLKATVKELESQGDYVIPESKTVLEFSKASEIDPIFGSGLNLEATPATLTGLTPESTTLTSQQVGNATSANLTQLLDQEKNAKISPQQIKQELKQKIEKRTQSVSNPSKKIIPHRGQKR